MMWLFTVKCRRLKSKKTSSYMTNLKRPSLTESEALSEEIGTKIPTEKTKIMPLDFQGGSRKRSEM